uniref:Uncharacterized protein n=1 Tax=Oryza brachyantha TaxID=4533 RepID=J3MSH4_ORYBR
MGSKVGTKSITQIAHELAKLNEVVESQQENISSAQVPLVEHFALVLVLGRKINHSRGVSFQVIDRVAEERLRLLAQIEAIEKCVIAAH